MEQPKKIRRPHVVSAGYQRLFSADGKRIRVVAKADLAADQRDGKLVGVKDNFTAKKHFLRVIVNGVPNDAVEDEFARLENFAFPHLRTVTFGQPITVEQDAAIKSIVAIHWARSFAHEKVRRERLRPQAFQETLAAIPGNERLQVGFIRQYGRSPVPGELEALLEDARDEMERNRIHEVLAIVQAHNYAIERFEERHIELCTPASRSVHFITSDSPTLIASSPLLTEVGSENMALGDAGFVMMPLNRHLAACITDTPAHLELDNFFMIRINRAMVLNSVSRLAMHPTTDLRRALGR